MDWRNGMMRTYELVRVDENWREKELVQYLQSGGTVTYENSGLICSAALTVNERLQDSYYRIYMVCAQETEKARIPLATVRMQTPKRAMNAGTTAYSVAGYSPLIELQSDYPPLGKTFGGTVVEQAAQIVNDHCLAPCSFPPDNTKMEPWTAAPENTWLDCLNAVLAKAAMHVEVDGMGTILFVPDEPGIVPVWVFDDAAYGLPSILMPDVAADTDYYDTKNKVEVVFSDSGTTLYASAKDENGIKQRGYVATYRETSPEIAEPVTQAKVDALAAKLLAEQSAATNTASFQHAFVPDVGVYRIVGLDYTRRSYHVAGVVTKTVIPITTDCLVNTTIKYGAAINDAN